MYSELAVLSTSLGTFTISKEKRLMKINETHVISLQRRMDVQHKTRNLSNKIIINDKFNSRKSKLTEFAALPRQAARGPYSFLAVHS